MSDRSTDLTDAEHLHYPLLAGTVTTQEYEDYIVLLTPVSASP